MIPVTMDFDCWANADYTEEFGIVVDGVPYSLTGSTFAMNVRRFPRATDSVFNLATVVTDIQGLRILDAPGGVVAIRINKATLETAYSAWSENAIANAVLNFTYDLRITHADGSQEVMAQGIVAINPGVTRP
jgi:hypothetical protein